jgi:hypothetical protein
MSDKINQLLEMAGTEDAGELTILRNAVAGNLKAYEGEPTAAHKKNLDAAREALTESVERMWAKYVPEDSRFKNLMEVVGYLKGKGYKIGKSKIYKDRRDNQIRVQPDGSVLQRDADAYSKTLQLLGDPLRGLEAAQQKIKELEAKRLQGQIDSLEYDLAIKRDRYVLREDAEMERAENAAAIFIGISNGIIGSARVLIETADGDPKRLQEFVEAVKLELNRAANSLAKLETIEFKLIL